MLIVSQNLKHYKMRFPASTIFRVNLAWLDNLEQLAKLIKGVKNHILIDMPIGRTKPPHNSYSFKELLPFIAAHKSIKYLAVSNIESPQDLDPFSNLEGGLILIPKIETRQGVENIAQIIKRLETFNKKIVMLDHDDLFSSLIKANIHPNKFNEYIHSLVEYCRSNDVILLRMRGVIFSD